MIMFNGMVLFLRPRGKDPTINKDEAAFMALFFNLCNGGKP